MLMTNVVDLRKPLLCPWMSMTAGVKVAALFAAVLALCAPASAQGVYHNSRIFVVPAPGKVAIDGDLSDWDLSGQILTYVVEQSMAYQSAKVAMMYDADALYISGQVADPTPMLNRADPAVNPDFGWDGDAFQLRLNLDPSLGYPLPIGSYDRTHNENLVNMTLWYYTDGKKPVLHIKYGMDFHDAHGYNKGVVPDDKYEAAYKKDADGQGYTFEYRIPWSTLGGPRPLKAGDLTAGAIQLQWSDTTGAHSVGSGWAVDLLRHAGFSYQSTDCWGKVILSDKGNLPKELTQVGLAPVRTLPLKFNTVIPKDSVVSVTLINDKGDRVRNIIAAEPRAAGALIEKWDGLDSAGHVLPPGKYTWKGAYHDPFKTTYVLAVSNSGSPPYNTADGTGAWGGDWGSPSGVAFSGDTGVLVWDGSEAGAGVIGINGQGRKIWGYRVDGSYVTADKDWAYVYMPAEKQIRAYTLVGGRQVNFQRGELWAENNALVDPPSSTPPTAGAAPPAKVSATLCSGLAYMDGKLYVAIDSNNEIVEYDAKQGTIIRRLSVPDASGITAGHDGSLLAVSHGTIVKVALSDGKFSPLIDSHVDHPQAVAMGPDGTVFVANLGKRQNVTVFSATGTYLRSIGKAGGRAMTGPIQTLGNVSNSRAGKWDPDTMLNPRGLAVDSLGRLWVAEHDFSPKRVSVWDPATGKLLDEKFGPAYVSTAVCMDPSDPTRIYCQNVEWKVDLDKGTWAPQAIMFDATPDTPYYWPHMVNNRVFIAKNGKQYMHALAGGAVSGEFLWVRRGDHFVAVAGLVSRWATLTWRPGAKTWDDYAKIPDLIWEDRNGDGIIQQNETRVTKMHLQNAHSVVDADLNLYTTGMYTQLYWERISPKRIQSNGVPLYDDASIVHHDYANNSVCYTHDLSVNPADGSVLLYAGADYKYIDKTGIWPITSWTKDGAMQWRYREGMRWYDMYSYPIPKPGELYGCTKNLDITDGITGYSCYFGGAQLMTTDGVPLGTVTRDGRSGATGADVIQCEWFTGQLVKIKDGRWFLLGGDQDGRVLQIHGLDTVKRFEGTLTISPEESTAAAAADQQWSENKAKAQTLVLARQSIGAGLGRRYGRHSLGRRCKKFHREDGVRLVKSLCALLGRFAK